MATPVLFCPALFVVVTSLFFMATSPTVLCISLHRQVRCRVTGSSLVEGWSAASLRPSILQAAVLRYQDLKPSALVEGEVAAVESFGLLVKLGEGVRALVPKNHLGDVTVKNPKARFKVRFRLLRFEI